MNPDVIRRLPGVQRAVEDARDRMATQARGRLAGHRKEGTHHITTEDHPEGAAVYFVGEAARAVEFGHFSPTGRHWIGGIHVLTGGRR